MEIITSNPSIQCSHKIIHQLLENKELLLEENMLLEYIKYFKSPDIAKRGYLSQKEVSNDSECILSNIDPSGLIPLSKYIELTKSFNTEILA